LEIAPTFAFFASRTAGQVGVKRKTSKQLRASALYQSVKKKVKRITIEFVSRSWTFRIVGIPGIVSQVSGGKLIPGKIGLQLLNILKKLSIQMTQIKDLPKAEVEIKFSKVA